ncbi:MAG: polysaccharide deacetylase family protein [Acidobacteriia bacterium]|nr:polysaccharide deacetylase family protein [Terriglobia bacterium]
MILPIALAVVFVALIIALCLYASFSIRSSLYGKIHWRGNSDRKQIALTFDDGPHPKYTREILNILKQENVPATFFLVGKKVEAFPEVAQEIKAAGHELAFHGFTHRPLWMKSRRMLEEEVNKSREVFRRVLGFEPQLFRPPYGVRGRSIMQTAQKLGWKTILWTRAGWDWTEISGAEVARRALRKPRAGGILLLHDSDGPSLEADRSRTVEALKIIIPNLKQQGFSFARVSEICRD